MHQISSLHLMLQQQYETGASGTWKYFKLKNLTWMLRRFCELEVGCGFSVLPIIKVIEGNLITRFLFFISFFKNENERKMRKNLKLLLKYWQVVSRNELYFFTRTKDADKTYVKSVLSTMSVLLGDVFPRLSRLQSTISPRIPVIRFHSDYTNLDCFLSVNNRWVCDV